MRFLKSCILAFSYYTRIPVPQISFREHDGDYIFCFFPLIGILTGAAELLWALIAERMAFGIVLSSVAAVAIPVLITGGIHLDGLLDTSDAMASWKSKEERLKIMHDPHTGAFAVISCAIYLILALGAASEVLIRCPAAGCMVFCLGRMYTALLVVFEKPAGNSGMLYSCTQYALKCALFVSTAVYLVCMTGFALRMDILVIWGFMLAAGFVFLILYRIFISRVFGGITGDLAGCFLSVCELILGLTAAFCG